MTDALPVDEGRRQAYLAALGIPLWGARRELPGALPAEALDFVPWITAADGGDDALAVDSGVPSIMSARQIAEASPAPSARTPLPATPAGARPSGPATHVGEEGAAPPHRPPPAASTAPGAISARASDDATGSSPDPAADARLPRLGCRVWALAPGLSALIDQGDAPDLSAAEHRLLANIALALDAPEPPGAVGNLLRWPLNANPRLDHGPAAMRSWLAHALRLPAGRCLVFGAVLAAHVRAARPDVELITAPSLTELLAVGDAKRELWRAIHG